LVDGNQRAHAVVDDGASPGALLIDLVVLVGLLAKLVFSLELLEDLKVARSVKGADEAAISCDRVTFLHNDL
jgi:hypothetical protein